LLDRAGAIPGLPASRALWHDRARYLALLGQADEAAAARQKAEQVPATSAHDHYLLATSHAHKGTAEGFQRALVDLGNALELEPRHYWSWFQRGLCHLELKEPLRAADDFRICIGLRPQEAWGHFNCGCAYDRGGNTLTAVRYYSEALKYQPDLVQAYTNRGMALLELKRYGEALADFDRARQLGRETAALQGGRGMALEGLGRHDEADAAFGQSLAGPVPLTLPDRTSLLWTYGFAVAGRRPEAAVKAFDAVLGQDAAHPQALYGRAMLAANQGQLAEAIRFFDRALSAQPGFTAARRYRAVLLARRGEHQRADEDVVQSLKEDSAGPLTLYAAACVFALQSEHRRDGRLAEKALLLLQQAAGRGADVSKAKDDPDLACLRLRPEFVELLQGR
jgi:tetratricopeptide (TPR) repeat protein